MSTRDISFSGISVLAQDPPPLRSFINFKIQLPNGELMSLHGMAVYVAEPGPDPDTPRICGVHLYGNGDAVLAQWEQFVSGVAAGASKKKPTSNRRKHHRYDAQISVRVRTRLSLWSLYTQNISLGGVFIPTNRFLQPNQNITLSIVHPENGLRFPVRCQVMEATEREGMRGIALKFLLGAEDREKLRSFIENDLALIEQTAA